MLGLKQTTALYRAISSPVCLRTSKATPSPINQLHLIRSHATAAAYDITYPYETGVNTPPPPPPLSSYLPPLSGSRTPPLNATPTEPKVSRTVQHLDLAPYDPALYWRRVPQWKHVTEELFLAYSWTLKNTVKTEHGLFKFLKEALPEQLIPSSDVNFKHVRTKDDFIAEALNGLRQAPMEVRLTPHILSVINWNNPVDDPVRRQFIPLASAFLSDHPKVALDSLHEEDDSPVPGLVHRYPDKALFLATSICPVYCRFCTRSYAIGPPTETVSKKAQKPSRKRWELVYEYIRTTKNLTDIVVSGGDTYYLQPDQITEIGKELLSIPHIKRIRFASKGLCVAPNRVLDPEDAWFKAFIGVSNSARAEGKHVCLHTHFNHPNEITWVTRKAAKYLTQNNVIVRNQSVLLKGVNDNIATMGQLIRQLADMNFTPYYVYQCDLVKGVEDLRTPLSTILSMEQNLRGTIAGFMMPNFVVDLPEGGGKRLATSYDSYSPDTGVSTFKAPGLQGEKGQRLYHYYDPLTRENHQGEASSSKGEPQHCLPPSFLQSYAKNVRDRVTHLL
ncbi:kama family protein [Pleomassaria siparia CBS 279.74]|uniref:Kama family protein n=1 Tax=Pleomassaria siparia CBS 279.74 TaxID=1314801 RepID=A0A6G1KHM8_9PLEO|nr:kama family protein [Pleomassaria siparia CBS 279.74]